jgi:hypothetical protein
MLVNYRSAGGCSKEDKTQMHANHREKDANGVACSVRNATELQI